MATEQPYLTPPITEALIEIRYVAKRSDEELERYSKKLASRYPTETLNQNYNLVVGPEFKVDKTDLIRRRSNSDETEIVLLSPISLFVAQLAPYGGWDVFFERFCEEYRQHKEFFGYNKISQIGLRYINRIDVEKNERGVFANEDYLNLHINLPSMLDPSQGYTLSLNKDFEDEGLIAIINSAAVVSPLPEAMAFILDIDLVRNRDLPQKDQDIFDQLEKMRFKKNEIFEACITDRSRQRFMDEARLG